MQDRNWIVTSLVDGRSEQLSETDAMWALTRAMRGMDMFAGLSSRGDAAESDTADHVALAA